jgi:hypothetical protein
MKCQIGPELVASNREAKSRQDLLSTDDLVGVKEVIL